MILSTKLTDGYGAKLPGVAGVTFAWTPGLNVLFGPNGCGKSTVLTTTATFAGCADQGWSGPSGSGRTGLPYPARFQNLTPKTCPGEVAWDGVPVLRHVITPVKPAYFSDDGNFLEEIQRVVCPPSTGEWTVRCLNALEGLLASPPDWAAKATATHDPEDAVHDLVAYLATLATPTPTTRRLTIILDEPDRGLSIPTQHKLWCGLLPRLARDHQVLVASHGPFVLVAPGAHVIEMVAGYAASCRETLKVFGGSS